MAASWPRLRQQWWILTPEGARAKRFPPKSVAVSLAIIAYSQCIAHGYDLRCELDQQKLAVASGMWPLYRFDPRRTRAGKPPLVIDMLPGKKSVEEYMRNEARFRMVEQLDAERFRHLARSAHRQSAQRVALYEQLSHISLPGIR